VVLSIHHVPGRLRLTAARFKGDPAALRVARRHVLAIDPVTGSLLIRYERERLDPATLWHGLARAGLVRGPAPFAAGVPVTRCEIREAPGDGLGARLLEVLAREVVDQLARRSVAAVIAALV
jgi:hypothetical protein